METSEPVLNISDLETPLRADFKPVYLVSGLESEFLLHHSVGDLGSQIMRPVFRVGSSRA